MPNAIITKISPVASQIGSSPEMVITGNNFVVGGLPSVFINDIPITLKSNNNTEIKLDIPSTLPMGTHRLVVLNWLEINGLT